MQSQVASNALRVGLLAWDYPPTGTGLASAAREVAEALAARGHDVRVLVLDRTDDEDAEPALIGAGRHLDPSLARLRGIAGTGHLAAPIAFARALATAHRVRPFDLVEATNWYAPAVCVPRLGIPLVTRCSTPASQTAAAGGPERVFDTAAAAALERRQAEASAGLISNTAHHAERMADLYGVSMPDAREGPPHAVIGLSLPPGTPTALPPPPPGPPHRLLFVGRPTRRKGFDAVLEAARRLEGEAEIRCVGVDPDSGLPPALTPLGRLVGAALHAEMAACHAVLAPSRYESFGLVYQEAIAAGRPIVACADDPAARAFVGRAETGILADECEGGALARAVRGLLCDAARYAAAVAACRPARLRFTRDTLGAETDALYRAVLARGR